MTKRNRKLHSIQSELLHKSREAALASVQIFNNPQIQFKSELFIVTMIIAWTYLFHAHYKRNGVDYRYYRLTGSRKKFEKTKSGACKHWELERCLNEPSSPLKNDPAEANLRFLIGLRHEIEHQMTTRIDNTLSAKFQACCLNFNRYVKTFFGDEFGIDKHLSFSLQFSSISREQLDTLSKEDTLPAHIKSFIKSFETGLPDTDFQSPDFAYRVFFVPKTANRKGQADQVIEFIKADSEMAQGINAKYALIKETEKPKYRASQVVAIMKAKGYQFTMYTHTSLWHELDAKNASKGYGVDVAGAWYWYDKWVEEVENYCISTPFATKRGV
ncbi:MAG: DUF3644 domain-containing protein [bacterium]|nr:DUF3644 domain-containing protein [bacterium]